jgi:4-amino-4-deoxy-L-arabinose transferase-like glycosyltransferase
VKPARWVLVLAAVLFICNIWGYDLWAPDEPFFGEGAREMITDGQWLVTHVNGTLNTHKPPLFFWLIALISLPLGAVTSFTARFPSVLAALTTAILVLQLGRRYSSEKTAVLGVFILATSHMFWDKARSVQIDALLCCLIWTGLTAFVFWRQGDLPGRRAGLIFWAAAALAVLAKGPVGVLVPLGIVLVTLAVDRRLGRWREFAPFSGPLLFALICGAWVAAATLWGPAEYSVWGALQEHFVDRGLHGMHHAQPWWYYAKVMPPQMLPWTFLVPGGLFLAWRRRDPLDRFLLVAFLFVVVFFSISTEKRTLYVLPAYPAMALLVARLLGALWGWDPKAGISKQWVVSAQTIFGGILVMAGTAVPVISPRFQEIPGWVGYTVGGLLLVCGLITLLAARRNLQVAVLFPAAGFALGYLFVAAFVFPAVNESKSSRQFAGVIASETSAARAAGHRVMAFDLGNLPVHYAFYTNGLYTLETYRIEALERHLGGAGEMWAVVNAQRLEELSPDLQSRLQIVATTRASRRDVALVSNRSD